MRKRVYRFFGGLLTAQEAWLNRMADRGYRLVRTGKLLYEFAECEPGQVQYGLEFIGQKARGSAEEYRTFLEDMGYRVFYKNINLNLSVGKVRWRPWAEKSGQIATNASTFNRELLIVEKHNDGTAFQLHTSCEDRKTYYKTLRKPYLFFCSMSAVFGILMRSWVGIGFAALFLIPLVLYQMELVRLNRQARLEE